jgi:hypothetical protein
MRTARSWSWAPVCPPEVDALILVMPPRPKVDWAGKPLVLKIISRVTSGRLKMTASPKSIGDPNAPTAMALLSHRR